MIDRFTWYVCCLLVLILQLVMPPFAASAADGGQAAVARPDAERTKDPARKIDLPITPRPTLLFVSITAGPEKVAAGASVRYELSVANTSAVAPVSNIRLLGVPPVGFRLKSGSVHVDGVSRPDPAVSADGHALIFTVEKLTAGGSVKIIFEAEVTAEGKPGKALSYASAISSGGGKSNIAKATVLVKENIEDPKVLLKEYPLPVKEPAAATAAVAADIVLQDKVTTDPAVTLPPVSPPQVAHSKTADNVETPADGIFAPTSDTSIAQNLVKLTGTYEIPVLADVDGHYVKNMDDTHLLDKEFASQVGEASLLESIRSGRSFSRESLAASARIEQAKAQTGQVFATLLPSVTLHANYGMETSQPSVAIDKTTGNAVASDTHSRTDAALTVRQPLFDLASFRDWSRREVIEKAREESYRVSDGDAYISAVNAYLSLVSSRLQTDMTREFEAQLNELLVYVEKRAKAGAASNSDMARVRARSQATLSSRLEQESAHAAAGIEFVRLTNLVPKKVRIPLLDDVGVSLLPSSFDTAVTAAMKSNPEIAALAAELQAAELDRAAIKGRYMPRVDAEYTYNYSLHAGGATNSSGQKDQRIMAVLNWNLFSGGADYKTGVERTARHKELQYRLDDQRRRVIQTLSANYATLATTRERITSGYQELTSISTAAEAMSKRMLSGNQSLLDLLDVYDRFYQVRTRLVSLHVLEMSTVAQLVRLTRGAPGAVPEVKLLKVDN